MPTATKAGYRVINRPNQNGVLEHGLYRGFVIHSWAMGGYCIIPLEGIGERHIADELLDRMVRTRGIAKIGVSRGTVMVTKHRRCRKFKQGMDESKTAWCVHVHSAARSVVETLIDRLQETAPKPRDVSFDQIEWRDEPEPAAGGYFHGVV